MNLKWNTTCRWGKQMGE